jgi:hypothetical protein
MTLRYSALVLPDAAKRAVSAAVLVVAGCGLAAAGPAPTLQVQVADSGPLSGAPAPVTRAAPVAKKPVLVTATGFEPAPMPNPDANAPLSAGARQANLAPAFFSQKAEFAGNGYAGTSSIDDGEEHRRTPAAGLALSVPMQ